MGDATWKKWCLLFLYHIFRNLIILERCSFQRWNYQTQLPAWSLTNTIASKVKQNLLVYHKVGLQYIPSLTPNIKISHGYLSITNRSWFKYCLHWSKKARNFNTDKIKYVYEKPLNTKQEDDFSGIQRKSMAIYNPFNQVSLILVILFDKNQEIWVKSEGHEKYM